MNAVREKNVLVATVRRTAEPMLLRFRRRRVLWLAAAIWVLSLADLTYTLREVRRGMFEELNPLAAQLIAVDPALLIPFKLGLVLATTVVLVLGARRVLTEIAGWTMLGMLVYVGLRWAVYYDRLLQIPISTDMIQTVYAG